MVYVAHGRWERRRLQLLERFSFLQRLSVRLGDGGCPSGVAVLGADGEDEGEKVGPGLACPPLCRLWEEGDKYPRWCGGGVGVGWGDGQACGVRNSELKESFSEYRETSGIKLQGRFQVIIKGFFKYIHC